MTTPQFPLQRKGEVWTNNPTPTIRKKADQLWVWRQANPLYISMCGYSEQGTLNSESLKSKVHFYKYLIDLLIRCFAVINEASLIEVRISRSEHLLVMTQNSVMYI